MKYKIAKSGPVGRQLKRIAAGQIKRAREALSRDAGEAADAVHEARRRFKRIRGVLRLSRRGLGPERFMEENVFFRDAGREIRAVRDAAALVEALANTLGKDHDLALLGQAIRARKEALGAPEQVTMLLGLLAARRRELRARALVLATRDADRKSVLKKS